MYTYLYWKHVCDCRDDLYTLTPIYDGRVKYFFDIMRPTMETYIITITHTFEMLPTVRPVFGFTKQGSEIKFFFVSYPYYWVHGQMSRTGFSACLDKHVHFLVSVCVICSERNTCTTNGYYAVGLYALCIHTFM